MKLRLDENWTTNNGGVPLMDDEVARWLAVTPSAAQLAHAETPFYAFIHFGMNTATGREWGNGTETVYDFNIEKIKPSQWVKSIKAAGAQGIILTCKHHDGFCLWNTGTTDFNVMHTLLATDIAAAVSKECKAQGLRFGVYLSPWDMHEKTYGTVSYDDFFCRQLTELLTGYGDIFEVWFDGAKGADAKAFEYDWARYYKIVRTLQPNANIAICGPDIRWIGNEGGNVRKSEYCVVPEALTVAETVQKHSQQTATGAAALQKISSKDEDLGSRARLAQNTTLVWYPAEADVSIRKGWFYPGGGKEKSVKKLFGIYLNTVGANAFLLLNVPPSDKGVIPRKDRKRLKKLGAKISGITEHPVLVQRFGELKETDDVLEFLFDSPKELKYCVLKEDITKSQRVEKFDLYLLKANGKYKRAGSGTVIGMQKIIPLKGKSIGAMLIVRQSRGVPYLEQVGFYE